MIMMINNSTIYYRCLFHGNTGLWRISKPTAEFDGDLFAWSSEGKKFLFQTKNKCKNQSYYERVATAI